MQFLRFLAFVVLVLTATASVNVEETGVRARYMLAMGDESILLTHSLRRAEQSD
ncbi:hypothetical protein PHMEG_00012577 [Phytophthora megakarya]|uniref:RxLR effector protein n=1 Tax=Phytophthora megakarya TaxID=4795 RepID=A0A225W8E0_9STRA|nr:hypothetical protein PHMEG_00012577 [Phytophthora megakarya]